MKKKTTKEDYKPNKLFYGDNLEVLRKYIKDESVDFCYIDPPFNSNRTYSQIYLNKGSEDKAQAQAFVDTWTWDSVAQAGYNEIRINRENRFPFQTQLLIEGLQKVLGNDSLLAYLIHITLRATEIQRVLKPTGSFYLHCDPTASHYLKIILDSVFCSNGGEFQNEIIWCYTIGGKAKDRFAEKHDVIFYYTKSNKGKHTFNVKGASIPRKENSHMKVGVDEEGRQYQEKFVKSSGKTYRYYLDEGKIAEDYWIDIETLNRADKERLGYPTQKPLALLDRMIKTSTNEGDVVLDAYCGCGTSVDSAERLGRRWIGIDVTYQSISVILKRLEENFKGSLSKIELNGVPKDWESAKALAEKADDKTRKEFEKWAILFYSNNQARINEKKGGDGGIDGLGTIQDKNDKGEIVSKKIIFSVKSDKVLTPAYVNQLKGKMHDEDVVMGILLTLNEPTKGMLKEAKDMGTYKSKLFGNVELPRLQIVSVKDMFNSGSRLNIPTLTT